MPEILRVYDPPECDERGVPLDWEKCRTCAGTGWFRGLEGMDVPCVRCGGDVGPPVARAGHGSLKAAALAQLSTGSWRVGRKVPVNVYRDDEIVGPVRPESSAAALVARLPIDATRCEDCGHPMSEGTWEGEPGASINGDPMPREQIMSAAPRFIAQGIDLPPSVGTMIHYSPCDEGCKHGGPGRASVGDLRGELVGRWIEKAAKYGVKPMPTYEASWRPVDVRTLGWPHDLRPEKLAVLCLRCYAERTR